MSIMCIMMSTASLFVIIYQLVYLNLRGISLEIRIKRKQQQIPKFFHLHIMINDVWAVDSTKLQSRTKIQFHSSSCKAVIISMKECMVFQSRARKRNKNLKEDIVSRLTIENSCQIVFLRHQRGHLSAILSRQERWNFTRREGLTLHQNMLLVKDKPLLKVHVAMTGELSSACLNLILKSLKIKHKALLIKNFWPKKLELD